MNAQQSIGQKAAKMLRPRDTVHKLLLSSPARFVAEYELADMVLTHAWGIDRYSGDQQSPLNRTFFMLSFETAETEKAPGVVVPNYSPTGDVMCALLSVLFGKRFDHHGAIEMTGSFHVPNLSARGEMCDQGRPYHGQALRADYPVALDLRELSRFKALIDDDPVNPALGAAFQTAALFYARALRAAENDAEVAYLHLITAAERIAAIAPLADVELEAEIATALSRIENELSEGPRVSRLFRSRLRHLKRRYVAVMTTHLDEGFYSRTEANEQWGAFRANAFPRAAAAAYDLRSRYVHTGASFGSWVRPRSDNGERQQGRPLLSDKEMAKLLARAPTFIGLERITRVMLLKCAEQLGAKLPRPIKQV